MAIGASRPRPEKNKAKEPAKATPAPVPATGPDVTLLGFADIKEQTALRKELFDLIVALGKGTIEEQQAYIAGKGWGKTTEITKDVLQACIEEVKKEQAPIVEAENIPEDF